MCTTVSRQSSGLAAYLKKFIVIQPGDWPCQFYCRQLVYECLAQHQKSMLSSECPTENSNPSIQQIPAMASLVPTMGPLHISLNSREDIFKTFQPFFQQVYNYMFPSSKLAVSPKPCRINLTERYINLKADQGEVSKFKGHAVWNITQSFRKLHPISVDNLYCHIQNKFNEYYNAMIRIWVMFAKHE